MFDQDYEYEANGANLLEDEHMQDEPTYNQENQIAVENYDEQLEQEFVSFTKLINIY